MLSVLTTILLFVIILGVIVAIHELGHFIFAKRAGIICHEYSIGMGPALYQKKKGETTYSIRAIPIGGFVMMDGEDGYNETLKRGETISLILNEQNEVIEIHDNELQEVSGVIIDFDLYGKAMSPLFIDLDIDGDITRYQVARDAFYVYNQKKRIQIAPEERSFSSKTLWQRFLTIFAGPMFNFILALVLYLIVGFFAVKPTGTNKLGGVEQRLADKGIVSGDVLTHINGEAVSNWNEISAKLSESLRAGKLLVSLEVEGKPEVTNYPLKVVLQGLGVTNYNNETIYTNEAVVGLVTGRSEAAGLETGDTITKIQFGSGIEHTITSWQDLVVAVNNVSVADSRKTITLTYTRGDNETQRTLKFDGLSKSAVEKLGSAYVVGSVGIAGEGKFNFSYSLLYPFKKVGSDVSGVFNTLGLLFSAKENIGIKDLSGPIGIATLVGSVKSQGLLSILAFTAFLSMNIGLINLLPIPALDGGRIVFLGYEFVTRRKIHPKVEGYLNLGAFVLLMLMFVYVTYNDIFRLF